MKKKGYEVRFNGKHFWVFILEERYKNPSAILNSGDNIYVPETICRRNFIIMTSVLRKTRPQGHWVIFLVKI